MKEPLPITILRVSKSYQGPRGRVTALHDVSLTIGSGSTLAITGQSGCGKSTLLSIVGAIEVPDSGEVLVGGQSLTEMSRAARTRIRRKQFGFVFQSGNLVPYLTTLENLSQQTALSGANVSLRHCMEMLGGLGLGDYLHKLPDQLSGGQRQRVAIARALVHRPRFVFADEPTGSLDPVTSENALRYLLEHQRETQATLVVVTHDMSVARQFDSHVVMNEGRIVSVVRSDERATER